MEQIGNVTREGFGGNIWVTYHIVMLAANIVVVQSIGRLPVEELSLDFIQLQGIKNYLIFKGAKDNTVEYCLLRALVSFDASPECALKWKGSNVFTIETGFAVSFNFMFIPQLLFPNSKNTSYPREQPSTNSIHSNFHKRLVAQTVSSTL
jgi:hypothetical protein